MHPNVPSIWQVKWLPKILTLPKYCKNMKAIELRIGNYVFNTTLVGIREVTSISKESVGLKIPNNGLSIYPYYIGELEPVWLNKDLLTKLGFYQMYKNESVPGLGVYVKDSVKIALSCSGWYCYVDNQHITPAYKYVHELQNLFYALTGKELLAEPAQTAQTI